jgi:hypothetical protein
MALINCAECGRQISDKATSCPGCGAPVVPPTILPPKISQAQPPPLPATDLREASPATKDRKPAGCLLKVAMVAVAIFAAIIALGIIASVLSGKKQPTAKTPQDQREMEERRKTIADAKAISAAKVKAEAQGRAEAQAAKDKVEAAKQEEDVLVMQLLDWSQDAVKKRLKSPSTAKFPGTILERSEYNVYQMPDGSYRVFSWVDSQNSFGAMLRSKWVVEFKKEKGEQWKIQNVTIE